MADQDQQQEQDQAARAVAPPAKSKGGRRTKLTEETQQSIIKAIKDGSFDYVAAEAAGITYQTFRNWVERGEKAKRGLYCEFYLAVMQARAQARKTAESRVWLEDPFKWLRFGPGREKPGRPGWTDGSEDVADALADMAGTVIKTVWGRADREPPKKAEEPVEEPALPMTLEESQGDSK